MKHLFKGLVASAMATVMCVSTSLSASAITYHGNTQSCKTSGGTNGYITINARVYTDYYQPYGGVNVYYYGVRAWIAGNTSVTTNFEITGVVTNDGSSTNISTQVTGNEARAYAVSTSSPKAYDYCSSTIYTNSSAFGSCTFECNHSFN